MKILFFLCMSSLINAMDLPSQRWGAYASRACYFRTMLVTSRKSFHTGPSRVIDPQVLDKHLEKALSVFDESDPYYADGYSQSISSDDSNYRHPAPLYYAPHSLIVAQSPSMFEAPKSIEQSIKEESAYLNYHTGVYLHGLKAKKSALLFFKRAVKGGFFDKYLPSNSPFSKENSQQSLFSLYCHALHQNGALIPYLAKMRVNLAIKKEGITKERFFSARAQLQAALRMPLQGSLKDFESSLSSGNEECYAAYLKFFEQLSFGGRAGRFKDLLGKAWDFQCPTVIKKYYNHLKTPEEYPLKNGYIMLPDWDRIECIEQSEDKKMQRTDDNAGVCSTAIEWLDDFEKGLVFYRQGKFKEAFNDFKQGIRVNRLSFFYLGLLASHGYYGGTILHDQNYAEKCFKILIERSRDPRHREFGYKGLRHLAARGDVSAGHLLVHFLAEKEPEKALSLLEWLEQSNADSRVLHCMPALSASPQKDYIKVVKKIIKDSEDSSLVSRAKTFLIDCCKKRVDFLQKAELGCTMNMLYWFRHYVKAKSTDYVKEDPDNCFLIAHLYGLFNDKDKERKWLLKMQEVQPAQANLRLGLSYSCRGQTAKDGWIADTYFKKALQERGGSIWYQAAWGFIKLHHAFYTHQYSRYEKQSSKSLETVFEQVDQVIQKEAPNEYEKELKKDYINKIFTHLLINRVKDEKYSSTMYSHAQKADQHIPIIKFLKGLSLFEKNKLQESYALMRTIEGLDSVTLPLLIELIWKHKKGDYRTGFQYIEKLLERIHAGNRADIEDGLTRIPHQQLERLAQNKSNKGDAELVKRARIVRDWISYLQSKIPGQEQKNRFSLSYGDTLKKAEDYKAQALYALYNIESCLNYYKEGKQNQSKDAVNRVMQAANKLIKYAQRGIIPKGHPLLQEFYDRLHSMDFDVLNNDPEIAPLFNEASKP